MGRAGGKCCGRTSWVTRVVIIIASLLILRPPCQAFYGVKTSKLTPDDPFVFVGENLTMECREKNDVLKADCTFAIMRHGEVLDSGYLQSIQESGWQAVRLQYLVDDGSSGYIHISCWLRCPSSNDMMIGSQYVSIDYPPGKLLNLTCTVVNWQDLVCTWDLPYPYNYPTNVSVNVKINRTGGKKHPPTNATNTSAMWKGFVLGLVYKLKARVRYSGSGSILTQKHVRTGNIVKPAPVSELRKWNCTATTIAVHLRHSDNSHNKNLHVEYSSEWNHSTKNYDWPRRHQPFLVTLSGLRPFTNYTLKVAVSPHGNGSVSDWRTFYLQTLSSAPEVAPELCPGCYTVGQGCTSHHCPLRLYWKPIPPALRNSLIKEYHLHLIPSTQHWTAQQGSNLRSPRLTTNADHTQGAPREAKTSGPTILEPAASGTSAAASQSFGAENVGGGGRVSQTTDVALDAGDGLCRKPGGGEGSMLVTTDTSELLSVDDRNDSRVWLFARTSEEQCSRNWSSIFVPARDNRPAGVVDVVAEVEVAGQSGGQWDGLFHLRWADPQPDTAFFVVVWCVGTTQHTHACLLGQVIQWRTIAANVTHFTINTHQKEQGEKQVPPDFIIGVVRHQRHQHDQDDVSSGITWSSCTYRRGMAPGVAPEVPSPSKTPTKPGTLHVVWNFRFCGSERYDVHVTHFFIFYCPTSPGGNDTCDGKEKTVRVERRSMKGVDLVGLEKGLVYRVRVAAASPWGQGPPSPTAYAAVASDTDVKWVSAVVILLMLSGLLLVIIVYVYCKFQRHYKKTSGKFAKTLDGNQKLIGLTTRPKGQVNGTPRPGGMTKQINVNVEIPLLVVQDVPREEEGEEEGEALLPKPGGQSASAHGSDSGVELPHSAGDSEDVPAEVGMAECPSRDPAAEQRQASGWGGATQDGGSVARTAPVSRVSSPPALWDVLGQREASPSSTHVPAWGPGVCEDADRTAALATPPRGGVCGQDGAYSEWRSSACPEEDSAYRGFDAPTKEASPCEEASLTDEDDDDDINDDDDDINDDAFQKTLSLAKDPDLSETSHELNAAPHTFCTLDASLEVLSKDLGGRVIVSAHPVSPCPPVHSLFCPTSDSQDEAISVYDCASSSESLNEEGESLDAPHPPAAPDTCVRAAVSGYSACVAQPSSIHGDVSNMQQSPVAVHDIPEHVERSLSSGGSAAQAPSAHGYIPCQAQPPTAGEPARCGYIPQPS